MKKLIYRVEGYTFVYDPETQEEKRYLSLATVTKENPSEADIEQAEQIAYNGEYTVEDDGQPEPEVQQSPEERIAELEEALALLLSGVTE